MSRSSKELLKQICRWFVLHPHWTLTLITLAALVPFLAKPFNIDDPLFVWTARQIQLHPGNPYGFDVNWYGVSQPMWSVTENPPLASYYLALAATIFGWSEVALHSAFLLPAIAVILGTYRLARYFCDHPALAALATLFAPVFLVSSTTLMCDVLMLAFWVWAILFWIEGTERNNFRQLCVAGLLIALAELTKYFGACLIPLLAAYSLISRRPLKTWGASLLIPLAALCAYQWATFALYGYALMSEAANYAAYAKGVIGFSGITEGLVALTFTGGCLAVAVFFAPLLWRKRTLAALAAGAALIIAALFIREAVMKKYPAIPGAFQSFVEIQIVFWATGGVCVLALPIADILRRRDARSWLLLSWMSGTFIFAAFINWTVNSRSILPMAPAMGILLARNLDQKNFTGRKNWPIAVVIAFVLGATLALLVARADFLLAKAVRQSAGQVAANYGRGPGTLWFQGHWGFQYYMAASGASAMDSEHFALKPGDNLVLPVNNTSLFPVNSKITALRETIAVSSPRLLATWNAPAGAGFYASTEGPLPFAIGNAPPENVFVFAVKRPVSVPPRKF
jgi:4-amino-4-deoxy-L-arabinose transferase-like glycosyltransferase